MSLLLSQLGGAGGANLTINLADTITLSDALVKAVGKTQTDTCTLSDAIVKAAGKPLADTCGCRVRANGGLVLADLLQELGIVLQAVQYLRVHFEGLQIGRAHV